MQQQPQKQAFRQKLNWKHVIATTVVLFIVYPKPFFYLMRPFVRYFKRSYLKSNVKASIERIIFSNNKKLSTNQLVKNNIIQKNTYIKVIDKCSQQIKEGQKQQQLLDLLAQNTFQQINMYELQVNYKNTQNMTIIVKGNKNLLRRVQAKLFGFEKNQLYKIRQFSNNNQVHILEKNDNLGTYEHLIKNIMLQFNQSI